MNLLYFTDISQFQYVLERKPQLLEQMQPITGDIVVAYELQNRNINFINEWDFLEPADIERSWEIANNLSVDWWNKNMTRPEYEGISLVDATRQDLVYSFEACLNANVVYERIFKNYPINRISGYFLPSVGVIRTGPAPTHRAVRSVSQAVLFWLADQHNIIVEKFEAEYPLSRGTLNNVRLSSSNLGNPNRKGKAKTVTKSALIVYGMMSGGEYKAVTESFNNLPDWQVFSFSNAMLDDCKSISSENSSVKEGLKLSWKLYNDLSNYKGSYPELFANPYLQFQFKRIWDEMEIAVDYGNVFSIYLDIVKPSVVFFGHEAFTRDRVLVQLAKKRNITTVGLLHGGLGHKIGYRGLVGDVDSVLVWNDIDTESLISYGVHESRLHKIGSISYEHKFGNYVKNSNNTQDRAKNKLKSYIGLSLGSPVVLILTTAINTGFAAPIADPRKHIDVLNQLLELIKVRHDLQFIIKAHPSFDYYEIYRRLNGLNLPNLKFLENISLDEAIEVSDVCIMPNYFTTAALEAMLNRVQVVYLDNAVYPLKDWKDIVPDFNINRVHSVLELECHLDKLLTDPIFRESSLNEADKLIGKILDTSKKGAKEQLLDFIKGIGTEEHEANRNSLKIALAICSKHFFRNIEEDEIVNFLKEIVSKYSFEHVLHSFSYIAGSGNLGISSIHRLFIIIRNQYGGEGLSPWDEIWWSLLQTYITGYNENSLGTDRRSVIKLGSMILADPKKFMIADKVSKKRVISFATNITIGFRIIIRLKTMFNFIFRNRKLSYLSK
ncbi:MAG TPA: hypothetical protein VIH57_00810 [Bacteroidales bacterium]